MDLPRRAESYLACVLLDLCVALDLRRTYDDIYNDIRAVDALPTMVMTDDGRGQFLRRGPNAHRVTNIEYAEAWATNGRAAAAHHRVQLGDFRLGRLGRVWDQLACQAVVRDRHLVAALLAASR